MGNISFKEYSIFFIAKIWVDWPGMDLSIYPRSRFGPSDPGFCFGLIWRGLGVAWSPPFLWAWPVGYWAHFYIPINIYIYIYIILHGLLKLCQNIVSKKLYICV